MSDGRFLTPVMHRGEFKVIGSVQNNMSVANKRATFPLVMAAISIIGQVLAGCGSLNTVNYFKPSIEYQGIVTKKARDGVAFSVGSACLYVAGASKDVKVRAMTLVGIPVLPISDRTEEYERKSTFIIELWLVPDLKDTYTFDVPRIELEFDNGVRVQPANVQVSRFWTGFESDRVETVSQAEHGDITFPERFYEPLKLWDSTRLYLYFEKPLASSKPSRLYILGLLQDGAVQPVPPVQFTFDSEVRQAFAGRSADGTSIADWPDKACRDLQQQEQSKHALSTK